MNKRLFAVLLCLVMIVGLMPFGAFAATDADTAYTATDTTAAADQAAADRTYLAFTSDVHNQGNNTSANRLNTWINAVTAKVGDDIDVMGFCGDFGNASAGQSDYWNYAGSVMSACEGNSKVHDHVYTTGNHEFNPGSYDSNNSAARGKIFRLGEAKKGNDYIVYAFGAHDWNNWSDHYDTGDISELNSYLAGLGAADRAKPIFILTHFPIHSYSSRRTTNADQVLNMLNGYADQGYKIYYLWGHNHSQSDPAYDEIYTGNVRINNNSYNFHFTYAAAGCMSDQEYGSGSASVKGKGLLVGIENGNVVSMNYYNENAVDVTENSYTEPTSQPTTSPTTPVSGNQYVIVIDGHALTTSAGDSYTSNSSSSYHYSGLAGKTYTSGMTVTDDMLWTFTPSGNGYLISNNGKYLNGTYASNSAGGSDGALNLNSTQDVWVLTNDSLKSTNASNGQSSDKFLAYGNGDNTNVNTFSIRSAPKQDNGYVKETVTLVQVGGSVNPTTQPTTQPGTTTQVNVTPTTENPTVNATINVGDTLTINVTNGSQQSTSYEFTATNSNGSVASLTKSSTGSIAAGASGTITVNGLAAGTTDITIQNQNQYGSQYVRKATIHLTVVSGGATPTTQPTTQPGTTTNVSITPSTDNPSASATINVGDTLSINVTNGSSNSGYNYTATLGNSSVAQITSTNPVNIAQGATGTITVKGLAVGTTDINIQNDQSYSQYARKAVIHLTVVSGGVTPTTQPTTQPTTPATGNVYELTNSLVSGKDYLIVNVNSGSGYALVNNNGTLSTVAVTVSGNKITLNNSGAVFSALTESGDLRLKNGNYYLDSTRDSSGNGAILQSVTQFTSESRTSAEWTYSNNQLKLNTEGTAGGGYTNTYTMYYDNGFKSTFNDNSGKIYLFVRTDSVTPTVQPTVEPTTEPTVVPTTTPCDHANTAISHKKDATCTEAGYTGDTVCLKCGQTIKQGTVINALGHDVELRNAKEATCTEAGYTGDNVCKRCGETITVGSVIKALGHDWDNGAITKAATCTAEGVMTYTCKHDASHTKTEAIPAKGHDIDVQGKKDATCTEAGYTGDEICKVCGETVKKGEVIPAKGHTWGDWVQTKAPTEYEEGVDTRTCSVCGATETRPVAPLGHTHVLTAVPAKAPTCTEAGYEAYWVCEGCHKLFSDAEAKNEIEAPVAIKALGHDTEIKNAKEATCTEAGYTGDEVCKVCGEVVKAGEVIPAKGHDTEVKNAKEATCEEAGYTGDLVCKVCGEVVQKGEVIEALGHKLVKHDAKAPTETEPGNIEYWECSECGKLFSDAEGKNEIKLEDTVLDPTGKQPCDGGANCPSIKLVDVDRTAKSYYHHAVDWAYVNDIVKGVDDTHFGPKTSCTREMMVTLLWRMNGSPEPKSMVSPFADVTNPDYYSYKAILWAAENGITKGTDEAKKLFSPKDNVTREQVVTLLWRLKGSETVEGAMQFTDVPEGRYSYEAVKWAVKEGITTGRSATSFAPGENCKRAEIVTFLWRFSGEPMV